MPKQLPPLKPNANMTAIRNWKKTFFRALSKTGNIAQSARMAHVKFQHIYRLRKKDPDFAKRFKIAMRKAADAIDEEIYRRGITGYAEPVFHNGKITGKVRKYSDTLLIFLAKGVNPQKYRENYTINHKGKVAGSIKHNHNIDFSKVSDEALFELERASQGRTSGVGQPSRN